MYQIISLQDIFQGIGNTISGFLNGIWTFDLSGPTFLKIMIFGIVLILSHSGFDRLSEELKKNNKNTYQIKKTPMTDTQKTWVLIIWSYLVTCLIVVYFEIGY